MSAAPLSDELCQQSVDLVAAHGSRAAAARALGMPETTFKCRYDAATRRGFQPQNQALLTGDKAAPPEGYKLKGTSTLYGLNKDTGQMEARVQWVKTDAALERLQAMQKAAFAALCAELKPIKTVAGPKSVSQDLLNLYTLTDSHLGMLAWEKETGAAWDLKIAERCLVGLFTKMIDAAPAAEVGIVNNLGDFIHQDSLTPETPLHRHVLDSDTRYQKMVEASVRVLRRIVEHALTKHARVHVFMTEGNHDLSGSVWLRIMFAQLYSNNPRVTVEQSPNPYVKYVWGKTFLAFHHGHLAKPASQPLIFAAKFPKEWGKTEHRYIHGGHRHHKEVKEHPGIIFEQHPTLAAPDAYAARGGWISKRQASGITYSKRFGEVARLTLLPEML